MIKVDWKALRPLNGTQAEGFEELCAQLARIECPPNSKFIRKGTPDGGVECYTILCDGSEWGWQTKYFDVIGDSQWAQIDKSVKTALEKHPRLKRYYVCIPLNLPDGRIEDRKSAQERWNEHVAKWSDLATKLNITIDFIYWGSSELIDRISRPAFSSKYRFWFDSQAFDNTWFTARLDEAIHAAGARYTPEIHVDIPIAKEFDIFGRDPKSFDIIKSHARDIRKAWDFFFNESKSHDSSIDPLRSRLSSQVGEILTGLREIHPQPIGEIPIQKIINQITSAKTVADDLFNLIFEKERNFRLKSKEIPESSKTGSQNVNPFSNSRDSLTLLSSALQYALEDLDHFDDVAGSNLIILSGKAGTGKTHLLCDIARQRLARNRPTIILMGQRFISHDTPWSQASQQLDLPRISAEEFIGALESAAIITNSRALIIIDAINEGSGREIWPSHLAAFISLFQKSPWIGIVISVRSSYETVLIPEGVRSQAKFVIHQGFSDTEYDAMRIFFNYYNLELPSTPLLAPEFRNPLFLKTLCRGLSQKGERRLPRGFHGITNVFTLYLKAINNHLSTSIGFNHNDFLVQDALNLLAEKMIKNDEHWLHRREGESLINTLLPGREYERSLYRALVVEGIITEEIIKKDGTIYDEVIILSYERFSDHIIAKMLLDTHLNQENPALTFADGGPLSYLCDMDRYVSHGLLEALCIQIPERINTELITLAPEIITARWSIGDAFRQSIIWRETTAFSDETLNSINAIEKNDHRREDTYDALTTVATIPKHPLNANFLNQHLRNYSMPDRDASWSVYLHNTWENKNSVDRLIDWCSTVKPNNQIDDETVKLCSITLAWMLTTSNRFLRDRATKALVNLLTGRLKSVISLIDFFVDVDDLYVAERIYAVAYGTAMRSNDSNEVGKLADCVFNRIFASREPPAHILLRDYSRGVIERAIYLGASLNIDSSLIRPPYKSTWPKIPSDEEIKPLLPDWTKGAYDDGDELWARNRIGSSVMSDDFSHYVIGTNSSKQSRQWLSVRLDNPPWQSPEERLAILVSSFSETERPAWESFNSIDQKVIEWRWSRGYELLLKRAAREESGEEGVCTEEKDAESIRLEEEREKALALLKTALSSEHMPIFERIINDQTSKIEPPRFDLNQIQRYILWRVFNIGWTTERFGHFDRFTIGNHGRDAKKAERIGKKYQWIAFHEIMALISDHFQYYDEFGGTLNDRIYSGPWQISCRDIDPSCTLRSSIGGTSWEGHSPGWWAPEMYGNWDDPKISEEWVNQTDDLPNIENFLNFSREVDGSRWLNLHGYFNWRQPDLPDHDVDEKERREIWYIINSYLIRTEDVESFQKWAKEMDFWGKWMPESPEYHEIYQGEYEWSPAAQFFHQQYCHNYGTTDEWLQPINDCPVKIKPINISYSSETGRFDCSVDASFSLNLPVFSIVKDMDLNWSANAADYLNKKGDLTFFDPAAIEEGPTSHLVREDLFREYLKTENLSICWTVLGEKHVIGTRVSPGQVASVHITGAYVLAEKGPIGSLTYKPEVTKEI